MLFVYRMQFIISYQYYRIVYSNNFKNTVFLTFPSFSLFARPPLLLFSFSACMKIILFVFLHDSTFSYILVCMIAFQHRDQNVYQTQSVLTTLHVSKKNARIHVLLTHVDRMPNARLKIIEHFVFVSLVLQEIHILSVKNVR